MKRKNMTVGFSEERQQYKNGRVRNSIMVQKGRKGMKNKTDEREK